MKIIFLTDSGSQIGEFELPSDRDELIYKRLLSYLKKNKTLLQNVTRQSMHQYVIDQYNEWMKGRGVLPMFNAREGKAGVEIANYLLTANKDDQDNAELSWRIILSKHAQWEPFHQKQLKLSQIKDNLVNIINNVRTKNISSGSAESFIRGRNADAVG